MRFACVRALLPTYALYALFSAACGCVGYVFSNLPVGLCKSYAYPTLGTL